MTDITFSVLPGQSDNTTPIGSTFKPKISIFTIDFVPFYMNSLHFTPSFFTQTLLFFVCMLSVPRSTQIYMFNTHYNVFTIKIYLNTLFFFYFSMSSSLHQSGPFGTDNIAISQTVFAYTDAHPSPVQCNAIISITLKDSRGFYLSAP